MGRHLNVERIRRVVQAKEHYGRTYADIAISEGVTRERIRQIYYHYLMRTTGKSYRELREDEVRDT